MSHVHGVGVIGAGDISASYLRLARSFDNFEIRAIASNSIASAQRRASEFGIPALAPQELLRREDISIVLNLTPPHAHFSVGREILHAGKHLYSEKPFATTLDDGQMLLDMAKSKGLMIASAPDTILGAASRTASALISSGALGDISGGTFHFMNRGMEDRHPNPFFFFSEGVGPILDIGPYYVVYLVNLLGSATRTVTAPGTNFGAAIDVKVPTTVHGAIEFISGAVVGFGLSWDVGAHGHANHIELYGSRGTMTLPDPDFFGGVVDIVDGDGNRATHPSAGRAFGTDNELLGEPGQRANYRGLGLAEMIDAIEEGRESRCGGAFSLHVIDVLTGLHKAIDLRSSVAITTACPPRLPFGNDDANRLLRRRPDAG